MLFIISIGVCLVERGKGVHRKTVLSESKMNSISTPDFLLRNNYERFTTTTNFPKESLSQILFCYFSKHCLGPAEGPFIMAAICNFYT